MIPVLVYPTLASSLQVREIHHSADRVLGIARHKKITHVVVPMKMLALPTVLKQPMTRTKLDPSHNRQRHRFLSSTFRVPEIQTPAEAQLPARTSPTTPGPHAVRARFAT